MSQQHLRRGFPARISLIVASAIILLTTLIAPPGPQAQAAGTRSARQAVQAGLTQLNQDFQANRYWNGTRMIVVPLTGAQDRAVLAAIQNYIPLNDSAWYINPDGSLYSPVGIGQPIPFATDGAPGAGGIRVQPASPSVARANDSSSPALPINSATGVLSSLYKVRDMAAGPAQLPMLWPFVLFTTSTNFDPAQPITLNGYSQRYRAGDWGLFCLQGVNAANIQCDESQENSWLQNGFNPDNPPPPGGGITVATEYANGNLNYGPYQMHRYAFFPVGHDGDPSHTLATGIWAGGSPEVSLSSASAALVQQAITQQQLVFVAVANRDWLDSHGNNLAYHVANLVLFQFLSGDANGPITGRFLGFSWPDSTVDWKGDLTGAVIDGQTVIHLWPDISGLPDGAATVP